MFPNCTNCTRQGYVCTFTRDTKSRGPIAGLGKVNAARIVQLEADIARLHRTIHMLCVRVGIEMDSMDLDDDTNGGSGERENGPGNL